MDIKYNKDTSKTNEDIEPKFGVWYTIESAPDQEAILVKGGVIVGEIGKDVPCTQATKVINCEGEFSICDTRYYSVEVVNPRLWTPLP